MTIFGLTLEQWSHFKLYLGLAKPLLLLFYLPVVLVLLELLFRAIRSWKLRLVVIPIYLILAWLIPLGDVTRNSIAMAKVCPRAGLHVYRTVVVDGFMPAGKGYLDKYGYKFVESKIDPVSGLVTRWEKTDSGGKRFDYVRPLSEWVLKGGVDVFDHTLGVYSSREVIQNIKTSEVAAERVMFSARAGWVDSYIRGLIDNSTGSCDGGAKLLHSYIDTIIIPSKVDKK